MVLDATKVTGSTRLGALGRPPRPPLPGSRRAFKRHTLLLHTTPHHTTTKPKIISTVKILNYSCERSNHQTTNLGNRSTCLTCLTAEQSNHQIIKQPNTQTTKQSNSQTVNQPNIKAIKTTKQLSHQLLIIKPLNNQSTKLSRPSFNTFYSNKLSGRGEALNNYVRGVHIYVRGAKLY